MYGQRTAAAGAQNRVAHAGSRNFDGSTRPHRRFTASPPSSFSSITGLQVLHWLRRKKISGFVGKTALARSTRYVPAKSRHNRDPRRRTRHQSDPRRGLGIAFSFDRTAHGSPNRLASLPCSMRRCGGFRNPDLNGVCDELPVACFLGVNNNPVAHLQFLVRYGYIGL